MVEAPARTLLDYLCDVEDFRRKEGRRYPLPSLLVMIIMAIMSGANGYREIARFLQHNRESLRRHLAWKREAMPSHVTIRTVLQHVDFDKLNTVFTAWARAHLGLAPGAFVALDAKAIRSSVSDYDNSYQDFVSVVSAFSHEHGTVVAMKHYHNKQESEITVAQDLIEHLVEALGLEQVVVTMDALHCKKNAGSDTTNR